MTNVFQIIFPSDRSSKNAKRDGDSDSESDEWDREEKKRLQDLEERDAFAERLRNKDKEKTKSVTDKGNKKVWALLHWLKFDLG